jgi:hypothetical protein
MTTEDKISSAIHWIVAAGILFCVPPLLAAFLGFCWRYFRLGAGW